MGQTRFPPQGGGVTLTGNNTWAGTQTFDDESFLVCDDGDDTKCIEHEVSAITTGTTRTITWPDGSGTVLLAGIVNAAALTTTTYVASANIRLNDNAELKWGSATTESAMDWTTSDTPNLLRLGIAEGNALQLMDYADRAVTVYDNGPWDTDNATNTSLGIFSNDGTSADKWFYLWHDETNAHIGMGTGGLIGYRYPVEVVTTTKTPVSSTDETDEGCELYTNTGDTDGSTITLPNDPIIGSCYIVAVVAAQTVEVVPNTNELLYTPGDQCTVDITSATQGAILEFIAVTGGDAGIWFTKGDVTGWSCNDT